MTAHALTKRDDLEEAVESYLAMLAKNGQVLTHYHLVWRAGTLTAYVSVPRPDALLAKHNSQWVTSAYEQVINLLGQPLSVEILNDELPEADAGWQQSDAFYLFAGDIGSVHCAESGQVMPAYLLPVDQSVSDRHRSHNKLSFITFSFGAITVD